MAAVVAGIEGSGEEGKVRRLLWWWWFRGSLELLGNGAVARLVSPGHAGIRGR